MDNSSPFASGITPLPGEVCAQFINCGKPGCRCQRGERHGPYFYRVWREGERVQKVYVRRQDVESVQAACRAYKDLLSSIRQIRERRVLLSRSLQREERRRERLQKQRLTF